jgi:hypothetical protein
MPFLDRNTPVFRLRFARYSLLNIGRLRLLREMLPY